MPGVGRLLMKSILILITALFFTAPIAGQTHFYLDERFAREAKLPEALVPLLRDVIKNTCRGQMPADNTDIRSWFSASRITLSQRRAYIVKSSGEHHCLTGADNDWFWIFLKTERGYRQVLTGGTLVVDVLKTKSRGLADIETNVATARTNYRNFYRFDGTVYKARKCMEATPPGEGKQVNVPCRH
jgi:hypothetical protein